MLGAGRSEIYFISAMMLLIIVVCVIAVYFFVKTYKKEMREREILREEKAKAKAAKSGSTAE